jgi:exportin-T
VCLCSCLDSSGWIDINLTVTPTTVPLLFTLLSDTSLPIRLATSLALLRIVSKGLKEPEDKLQLIKVLSLGQVIDALETTTRTQRSADSSEIDEGEESYREALGRLLNVLGLELAKLADVCLHVSFDSSFELTLYQENANEKISSEASGMLTHILPVMLQFMADEYDDTCSTIFPLLSNLLSGVSTPLIARGLVLILSIVQTQSEDIV